MSVCILFLLLTAFTSCQEERSLDPYGQAIGERTASFYVHVESMMGGVLSDVDVMIDQVGHGKTNSKGSLMVTLMEGDHQIVLQKEGYRTLSGGFYSSPFNATRTFKMYAE